MSEKLYLKKPLLRFNGDKMLDITSLLEVTTKLGITPGRYIIKPNLLYITANTLASAVVKGLIKGLQHLFE